MTNKRRNVVDYGPLVSQYPHWDYLDRIIFLSDPTGEASDVLPLDETDQPGWQEGYNVGYDVGWEAGNAAGYADGVMESYPEEDDFYDPVSQS